MQTQQHQENQIVGAWRLGGLKITNTAGETVPVYGDKSDGILIYLENGIVSVHVSNVERPRFLEDDFFKGTCEELRQAFEGYLSYFGTYEYVPDEGYVIHSPIESLFPNWSGSRHTRYTQLDGNTLNITTPPIPFGDEECVMKLEWVRMN